MKYPIKTIGAIVTMLLTIIVWCGVPTATRANSQNNEVDSIVSQKKDSIIVSLLTCSPRDEVYALYGHTAIRCRIINSDYDWVFNYGVFNFNKPHFVLRFVFGLTDYELGVVPFNHFVKTYHKAGCRVTEQTLNLTSEEGERIIAALDENYRPENRTYRYNYFYDNCTTRARDIIEKCINGKIEYISQANDASPYRSIIHKKTTAHPWNKLGNDLCLGLLADCSTDFRERQFLPENLMNDFASAKIAESSERDRALIKSTNILFDTSKHSDVSFSLFSPYPIAVLLLVISTLFVFIENRRRKTFLAWDIVLMALTGLAGIIILALFFSQHPTTSTNLQIFLLNPLPLFFIFSVARGKCTRYWKLSASLLILFFIGALFQDYADGTLILALCLLMRCWINLKFRPTPQTTNNKTHQANKK